MAAIEVGHPVLEYMMNTLTVPEPTASALIVEGRLGVSLNRRS
jgi:hypothetical protein